MADIADLERGAQVAGGRGYFLKGAGVQLNLALINYGISFLVGRKYDQYRCSPCRWAPRPFACMAAT